ncbi:MAG: protein kinase [Bryobacteraceae bacterium]|nr:protein kinase [Bryobacteraceae bacterium]
MPEQFATSRQPERNRWLRVKEVLAEALDLPVAQRSIFLAHACGADIELRDEIETLLDFSDEEGSGFIDTPAIADGIALMDRNDADAMMGRILGHYRIVEFIGEGGTGTVYRAVRDDVGYERNVAIKILRRGMNSATMLRRFRDETRILARLDHPNIARFHEAGIAADGRPYFVMEFLEGIPVHHYCRENSLTLRERVELFLPVCSAVEYSHRNLVIHRDLKASNILVTAAGVPKLLDFGIAKLLDRSTTGSEEQLTEVAERMMTPDYASPEQILGEAITTAADVYSLGVLLYELVADQRPLQLAGLTIGEMARVVQTTEIRKPSDVAPADRRPNIAGDLDTVILKALHRSPDGRYGSPENLSDDLRRYLNGRPVFARPDTHVYRFRKFVSRNRTSVLVSSLAILALLAGGVTTVWQSAVSVSQEEQARRRFRDIRELANGLLGELDTSLESLPGATSAREILARKVLMYLDGLARDQVKDSGLARDLASAYERLGDILGGAKASNLGDSAGSLDCYTKALAILERVTAAEPGNFAALREKARTHTKLSDVLAVTGDSMRALEEDQKALSINNAWLSAMPDDGAARRAVAFVLQELAGDLDRLGRFTQALETRRSVLAIFRELVAKGQNDSPLRLQLALANKRLGRSLLRVKQLAESKANAEAAIAIEREELAKAPLSPNIRSALAYSLTDLGVVLRASGDPRKAVWPITEGLSIRDELVRADPKDWRAGSLLAASRFELGKTFFAAGELPVAQEQLQKSLELRRELVVRSPGNTGAQAEVAEAAAALADVLQARRQDDIALPLYREASTVYMELRRRGSLTEELGDEPARVAAAAEGLTRFKIPSAPK